jgi:hypothetical protein
MRDNTKEILPGWTLKVDEFAPRGYRIILTDEDGRKVEVVDDYNDATLDKCIDYAFEIEKQTKRNWNKFLFDFSCGELKDLKIEKQEYHDEAFGSWTIQINDKRLLLDGRDGWLIYEQRQGGDWIEKEAIKNFKTVTLDEFKSFMKKIA